MVKNLPANAGDARDAGLIPGLGRSAGGGHGNPLQYSCLENPMNRGAWQATVHGITKTQTGLSGSAQRREANTLPTLQRLSLWLLLPSSLSRSSSLTQARAFSLIKKRFKASTAISTGPSCREKVKPRPPALASFVIMQGFPLNWN